MKLNWLKIFNRKGDAENPIPKPREMSDYDYFLIEREKEHKKHLQYFEDRKIKQEINREANRLYIEWENTPAIKINNFEHKPFMCIIKPFVSCYIVHDAESAKYKGVNINQLIREEFIRIKNN